MKRKKGEGGESGNVHLEYELSYTREEENGRMREDK